MNKERSAQNIFWKESSLFAVIQEARRPYLAKKPWPCRDIAFATFTKFIIQQAKWKPNSRFMEHVEHIVLFIWSLLPYPKINNEPSYWRFCVKRIDLRPYRRLGVRTWFGIPVWVWHLRHSPTHISSSQLETKQTHGLGWTHRFLHSIALALP